MLVLILGTGEIFVREIGVLNKQECIIKQIKIIEFNKQLYKMNTSFSLSSLSIPENLTLSLGSISKFRRAVIIKITNYIGFG